MVSFHRQSIDDEFPEGEDDSINRQYKELMHSVSTVCSFCTYRISKVNDKTDL